MDYFYSLFVTTFFLLGIFLTQHLVFKKLRSKFIGEEAEIDSNYEFMFDHEFLLDWREKFLADLIKHNAPRAHEASKLLTTTQINHIFTNKRKITKTNKKLNSFLNGMNLSLLLAFNIIDQSEVNEKDKKKN